MIAFGSVAVAFSPPTRPCWTVATGPEAFRPPTSVITSPTWAANPSTFSSYSGDCSVQGPGFSP